MGQLWVSSFPLVLKRTGAEHSLSASRPFLTHQGVILYRLRARLVIKVGAVSSFLPFCLRCRPLSFVPSTIGRVARGSPSSASPTPVKRGKLFAALYASADARRSFYEKSIDFLLKCDIIIVMEVIYHFTLIHRGGAPDLVSGAFFISNVKSFSYPTCLTLNEFSSFYLPRLADLLQFSYTHRDKYRSA